MTSRAKLGSYLGKTDYHRQSRAVIDRICGRDGMQELLEAQQEQHRPANAVEDARGAPGLRHPRGLAHVMGTLHRKVSRHEP